MYKRQDQHVVGVAKGVDPEIIEGLRANFEGDCSEVGMYLVMARVAHREGYPEIGLYLSLIHISPPNISFRMIFVLFSPRNNHICRGIP